MIWLLLLPHLDEVRGIDAVVLLKKLIYQTVKLLMDWIAVVVVREEARIYSDVDEEVVPMIVKGLLMQIIQVG